MAIDLAEHVKDGEGFDHLHIVRVEQLYPFPSDKISDIVSRYPNAKELVWVQEEPKNMGSWHLQILISRKLRAIKKFPMLDEFIVQVHLKVTENHIQIEQKRIIDEALNR